MGMHAHVDTGPTDLVPLDHGNFPACFSAVHRQGLPCLAASNDQKINILNAAITHRTLLGPVLALRLCTQVLETYELTRLRCCIHLDVVLFHLGNQVIVDDILCPIRSGKDDLWPLLSLIQNRSPRRVSFSVTNSLGWNVVIVKF
jgi:hypothetical protein